MPARIVIHAGFHKTGTTSVQRLLRASRALLKPCLALRLPGQMRPLLQATRGYSTRRDPVTLNKAQSRFEALLAGLPAKPRRTLVISAEELSGHMPGRGDLASYAAAPDLLETLVAVAQRTFPKCATTLYFSTRAPMAWLRSAYAEHLKSSAMTLDFDAFAARYADAADLDAIMDKSAARAPCPAVRSRLEGSALRPLGPADPLLDLCALPDAVRARIGPQPTANTRLPDAVLLALLAANRAYAVRDALRAAKAAILAQARLP